MARRRSGQGLVDYVILLALACMIAVSVVSLAGPHISEAFGEIAAAANPAQWLKANTATAQGPGPQAPSAPAPAAPMATITPTPAPPGTPGPDN